MLQHASRFAAPSPPLFSILQAAASRAWCRTLPARRFHQASTSKQEATFQRSRPRDDVPQGRTEEELVVASTSFLSAPTRQLGHIVYTNKQASESSDSSVPVPIPSVHVTAAAAPRMQPGRTFPAGVPQIPRRPDVLFSAWYPLEEDISIIDPGRAPSHSYEDDPPWPEVVSSMRSSQTPLTTVYNGDFDGVRIRAGPKPRSPKALHQNLLRLLAPEERVPLPHLVAYHEEFPSLQSVKSYNVIIALAIRLSSFGVAERLLTQMQKRNIEGNLETSKLRVRLMIRWGHWGDAWVQELARAQDTGGMPLAIWLEFFWSRDHKPRRIRDEESTHLPSMPSADFGSTDASERFRRATRIRQLRQQVPKLSLTPDEWAKMPPRVVLSFVRALLYANERDYALSFTTSYFQQLPQTLDKGWLRQCIRMINLHLLPGWKRKLSEFYCGKRTLLAFLAMHPQFRPNSDTLFYLLRTLKKTAKCGSLARRLVRAFRATWGPKVIDDRVQRRLASLALKEGRLDVASSVLAQKDRLESSRKMWRVQQEVQGGTSTKVYKRRLRPRNSLIFPRRMWEESRWRLLRRRLLVRRLTRRRQSGTDQATPAG